MHDARTALTAKDYPRAVQLLTAIVDAPDNAFTPEALELLGLARERNNQLAHAKAEYEEYLRRYPKGPDADRVRQRLAGVLAVGATPEGGLRQAGQPATGKPPGLAWEVGGSFSEYYFFDDGFQRSELLPSSTQVGTSTTDNQLNQNQLLSTVDGLATVRGPGFIARGRVSATYTEDFLEGGHNQTTLSALYVEAMDTHQNLFGRVGRQTRSTGGLFGRFDGGLFSVRVAPEVKLEVATGYPVDSSRNLFLQSNRPFVAADVALGRFLKSWDANLYFVDQANYSLRRSPGGGRRGAVSRHDQVTVRVGRLRPEVPARGPRVAEREHELQGPHDAERRVGLPPVTADDDQQRPDRPKRGRRDRPYPDLRRRRGLPAGRRPHRPERDRDAQPRSSDHAQTLAEPRRDGRRGGRDAGVGRGSGRAEFRA